MLVKNFVRKLGLKRRPKLLFVDICELYSNTLYRSGEIRPWAIENGKYIGLELKYNFASCYLKSKDEFNYHQSEYFQFIKKYNSDNFKSIYEGNSSWAYANADNLCNRYVAMINLFLKHISVYNALNKKNIYSLYKSIYNDIIDFEKSNQVEIRYIEDKRLTVRKESEQYNKSKALLKKTFKKRLIGHLVPTGVFVDGNIVCCNGTHRLALFRALHDMGMYANLFPIYLLRRK